jgi:hypothetical protein
MNIQSSPGSHRAASSLLCALPMLAGPLLLCFAGCASPGEPVERKAPVPAAISDLSAQQSGNSVVLTCSIPRQTADHISLDGTPAVEIYRAIHPVGQPSSSAPALVVTIPSAMVTSYVVGDRFRYVDPLTAGAYLPNAQQSVATYLVRTSASPKKESTDSNRVDVAIVPAPHPITDLQAQVVQSAITLSWSAPQSTLTGGSPVITGYRIYRANAATPTNASAASAANSVGETTPAAQAASMGNSATPAVVPAATSSLTEIGDSTTTAYKDADAQRNKSYVYSVRSTIDASGKPLESDDSNLVEITLNDAFPPSAPTGLTIAALPAQEQLGAHIDISWAINPETDLVGYNVYRSEQAGVPGTRQNPGVLPTPAFRDMNALPGRTYFYTVTAVDRTGNESAASAAVQAGLPATTGQAAGSQASP